MNVATEDVYFVRDYRENDRAYIVRIRDDRFSWAVHDLKADQDVIRFSGFAIQRNVDRRRTFIALATKNHSVVDGRTVPDWAGEKIFLAEGVAYAIDGVETRIEFRDWVFVRHFCVLRRNETVFSIAYVPPLLKEVLFSDGEPDQYDFLRFVAHKTVRPRGTVDDLIS